MHPYIYILYKDKKNSPKAHLPTEDRYFEFKGYLQYIDLLFAVNLSSVIS